MNYLSDIEWLKHQISTSDYETSKRYNSILDTITDNTIKQASCVREYEILHEQLIRDYELLHEQLTFARHTIVELVDLAKSKDKNPEDIKKQILTTVNEGKFEL